MSTLIVSLPPREPAVPLQDWQWPELPFALLDKGGRVQRAGRASLPLLPRADATVLVVAARDVLLIAASVPPLKGPKLKQALPNIVEDQLIQDPQHCHVAIDPAALADGRRVLAVIDRAWLRFVLDAFVAAGHRRLRAVPATRCLPPGGPQSDGGAQVDADSGADVGGEKVETTGTPESAAPHAAETPQREPLVALALGRAEFTMPALVVEGAEDGGAAGAAAGTPRIEFALARGALGEGLVVPEAAAAMTLAALAGDAPLSLFELGEPGGEPQLSSAKPAGARLVPGAAFMPFDAFARRALETRFDLCQFEFEVAPWRFDRATLVRLRVPALLAAVSIAVAIVGMNLQWWKLARERDALSAQITETLLTAFPKTTTVLDPAAQMTRQVDRLRVAAGELSPNDFLALAAGLSRSLGPLPENGIASLDYHDRRLDVAFKPTIKVDPDFVQRLARNGLAGEIDSNTGNWTIRSHS